MRQWRFDRDLKMLWGLFFSVVLGLSFIQSRLASEAEVIIQQIGILNIPPHVESVTASLTPSGFPVLTFIPRVGGSTLLYVSGSASDQNGCVDLHDVVVKAYRSDLGPGCAEEAGRCIVVHTTNFTGCVDAFSVASFDAVVSIPFFTDPTDAGSPSVTENWVVSATVADAGGLTDTGTSDPFEMASLLGLDVSDSVDFGLLEPGAVSLSMPVTLTNLGNRIVDASVQMSGDFACSGTGSKTLPATDMHVSLDQASDWNKSQLLAVSSQSTYPSGTYLAIGVPPSTGSVSSKDFYLTLKIPDKDVLGICSNMLGITAIAP